MKKLLALIVIALLGFYVAWPAYTGYRIHAALERENADQLSNSIDFPQVRGSIREPVLVKIDSRINELLSDFGAGLGLKKEQIKTDRIEVIVDGALDDVVSPERLGALYKRGGDVRDAVQQAVLRQIDEAGGIMSLFDMDDANNEDDDTDDSSGGGFSIGGVKISGDIGGLLKNKNSRKLLGDLAGKLGGQGGLANKLFPKKAKPATSGPADKKSFGLSNIKHFGFRGPLAMEIGIARDGDAAGPDVTARLSFQDMDWKVTHLIPNLDDR